MASADFVTRHVFVQNVDNIAATSPEKCFASVPKPTWQADGWQDISYAQISRGINYVSWWLDRTLTERRDFEGFAYIGPDDLRYSLLVGAAMKTKCKVLFADAKVSVAGQLSLLEATGCRTLVCAKGHEASFLEVQKEQPELRLEIMPNFETCIASSHDSKPFPFHWEFPRAAKDPVLIVHTSGTTGLPKPITLTHEALGVWGSANEIRLDKGQPGLFEGPRTLLPVPLIWVVGIMSTTVLVPSWGVTPVLLPVDAPRPATAAYLQSIFDHLNIDDALLSAFVLKELAKDPKALQRLERFKAIWTAGASLDQWIGDLIWQHVPLHQALGSTEAGPLPCYQSTAKDWRYFRFLPQTGYRMDAREDGLYELVIVRKPELARYQLAFVNFPDLDEYRTNDVFEPHPELADYWLHVGRADDFMKLSKYERLYAGHMETTLEQHPCIHASLVGGNARPKPFALIEAANAVPDGTDLKMEIWQAVEKMNETVEEAARIPKELVMLVDGKRPLPRLAKGTLNRREALATYAQDVDALYAAWARAAPGDGTGETRM